MFSPDGIGPAVPRDATGAFSLTTRVPTSTSPGTHSIGMRCGGGNVGVSATLRVTAQVQQVPNGAPQAGLGGAGHGADASGWMAAGVVAAVVAGLLAAVGWRRRLQA